MLKNKNGEIKDEINEYPLRNCSLALNDKNWVSINQEIKARINFYEYYCAVGPGELAHCSENDGTSQLAIFLKENGLYGAWRTVVKTIIMSSYPFLAIHN